MATLRFLTDEGQALGHWELGNEPVAVGRDVESDIVVDDASLSRRHFVVSRDGQGYVIKDLHSANGTWVDGKRVVVERLGQQVCIVAGRCVFMFTHTPNPGSGPATLLPESQESALAMEKVSATA